MRNHLVILLLCVPHLLFAQKNDIAGTIVKIEKNTILVKYSNPAKPFNINDKLYINDNGKSIEIIVKYPMQSSAQCHFASHDNISTNLTKGQQVFFTAFTSITRQESRVWLLPTDELRMLAGQNVDARLELGERYRRGSHGIAVNYEKALLIFDKLAIENNPIAQYNIGIIYNEGYGVKKDQSRAMKQFQACITNLTIKAKEGNAPAQYARGVMCENGYIEQENIKEAFMWYQKAAEQDYIPAQNRIGVSHMKGTGINKDTKIAVELFHKAASYNDTQAQTNLGLCYENGIGVEKNITTAMSWYRKAASKGNKFAITKLESLIN